MGGDGIEHREVRVAETALPSVSSSDYVVDK